MSPRPSGTEPAGRPRQILGRYVLFGELASGGMATVHLGRLLGPAGFTKTVAIKRLHAQYAKEPEFVSMFLDEARLAARIQHPNVVATLDVVPLQGEVYLVMDYVEGESLSRLIKAAAERNDSTDPKVAAAIVCAALQGLHAAHDANDERGRPLGIVHRDVSPQNVLVGTDGIARVLDFGVAKARGRLQSSREGQLKGKLTYMAPEQVHGKPLDRRTDVYAASVMLWEVLTGKRLVGGDNEAAVIANVMKGDFAPPSQVAPWVTPALDALVMRGLEADPERRFPTAREMAIELDRVVDGAASAYGVGEWVERLAGDALKLRAKKVREMESSSAVRQLEAQRNMAPPLPPAAAGERTTPPPIGTAPPLVAPPPSASLTPPPLSLPPLPGDRSFSSGDARPTMRVPPPDVNALASLDAIAPESVAPGFLSSPSPADDEAGASAEPGTERAPASRRRVFLVGALAGLVALALAAWWLGRGEEVAAPEGAPTHEARARVSAPAPTSVRPSSPATTSPTTAATAAPARATAEGASGERAQTKEASHPTAPAARPPNPAPAAATAPAKPARRRGKCSPPFYLDSEGVKHIKPECL